MHLRNALILLAAMTLSLAHARDLARPLITVGESAAPTIDGQLADGEWAGATGVGAFSRLGGALVADGPSCLVAADDRGISFAWVSSDPPDARQRGRDGAVWQDDAVEVFLQPPGAGRYYQVIANAAGDFADYEGRNASWDAEVQVAVAPVGGGWSLEMRIPWTDLGGAPEPGDVWRANFARDIAGGTPLTWAPVEQSFHEPANFGDLQFVAGPSPVGVETVAVSDDHRVLIAAQTAGPALSAGVLADGDELVSATVTEPGTLELPIAEPGLYLVRIEAVSDDGAAVFRQEVRALRGAPLEMTVLKGLLEADRVIVQMDASAAAATPDAFRVQVGDLDPVRVDAGDNPLLAEVSVDIASLDPGAVTVRAQALRETEVIARAEKTFDLPPDPDWLGSDEGRSDAVSDLWMPVRVEDGTIRVWGRQYAFGEGPLLSGLTTGEKQVLAAPMRLVTVVGGRQQTWRDAELRWTARGGERAEGVVTAQGSAAALECDVGAEFDGMVRFDLQVVPVDGAALEEIVLEIPLREEYAKYLHLADASWGGSVSTALPEEGWEHHFMPFVWLGDEWRGVQWFAESDETWRPADPGRAITISRRDGVTTLRLHMVERALQPGASFAATFGLQATPVRDVRPEHREWHITHGAWYGMEDQPASANAWASYPAGSAISLERGTVEMWVSPLFDPAVEVEQSTRGQFNRELFRLVQANGDHVGFYWNIDDRSMRLYSRLNNEVALFVGPGTQEPWEQDSWHHVAFTWGDGAAAVWVDGERLGSREFAGPLLPGTLEGAEIILGSAGVSSPSEFAVDEFRISESPREFEGLPPRDLSADESTLLLDSFEGDPVEVAPEGFARELHGESQISFVNGVDGRAIAFGAPDDRLKLLDYLASVGVNTLVIHEQWTEIQAYGSTELHRERLHSLVEACHDRGIRLLVYFGYQLSDIAPLWEPYRDELLVKPRCGGYTRKDYPQTAYIACHESPWREYYLTSIARLIDEYDIDGVYLDGTTEPFACSNELHGCGYVGEDGQRHRTYPIFAVRDLMRRMRHVIKSRKPDGLISAHMSATVSIPTLAFVDSYWDGEQLDVHEHGFRLPLDAFRAEFMGHNWGVPAEFLSYLNRPFTYQESVPLALLHDVPVRPYARAGDLLGMMSRVWDAWDAIDIERAEWFPYWQGGGPVTAEAEDALVSTHVGPGGMLVVAMNATGEDRMIRLTLSADAATVRELIRDREIAVEDGAVTIDTPAWEGAVLMVK